MTGFASWWFYEVASGALRGTRLKFLQHSRQVPEPHGRLFYFGYLYILLHFSRPKRSHHTSSSKPTHMLQRHAKTALLMTSHDLHVVAITRQACAVLSCQLFLPILLSPHERVSLESDLFLVKRGLERGNQTHQGYGKIQNNTAFEVLFSKSTSHFLPCWRTKHNCQLSVLTWGNHANPNDKFGIGNSCKSMSIIFYDILCI